MRCSARSSTTTPSMSSPWRTTSGSAKLAEAAFTVADEHQGRGIGTRLLERLAERAAEVGIERFVAYVLPDNRAMLGVFEAAGFELTRELEGGELEVQFPIAPTETYREHVDSRDHEAVVASLRPFFEPSRVVVGASKRRGSIGGELFRNILAGDFDGAAYPVNRDGEPVAGVRGYRSIEEIPDPIDLAVVTLPAAAVLEAAEQALRKGVRALVVISAGFAEIGREGIERQERLLALVRAHGARLIGPNCLGVAVSGPSLNATFAARSAPAGNIGFSSQSGARPRAPRGGRVARPGPVGVRLDRQQGRRLDERPARVVGGRRSHGCGADVRRVLRQSAPLRPPGPARCPLEADPRAEERDDCDRAEGGQFAHGGAGGLEAAVDALFHQAGVIRAASLEELVDVASLLSHQPEPKGRRVAVLTNAGGLGILCADACDAAGLVLPQLDEETRTGSPGCWLQRRAWRTPSTCSAAQPPAPTLPPCLWSSRTLRWTPSSFSSSTVTATADEVAAAIDRATAEPGAASRCLPSCTRAGSRRSSAATAPALRRSITRSRQRALGRLAERGNGCASRTGPFRRSTGSTARRADASSTAHSTSTTTCGSPRPTARPPARLRAPPCP